MEIQDIRRARLAELIAEKYQGSQSRFVEETGENQGEVSALLKNKSFGEKKARKIEEKCGLPPRWLDRDMSAREYVEHSIPQSSPAFLSEATESEPMGKVSLVYVTPEELNLLTFFRQSTPLGQGIILVAAETTEKQSNRLFGHQS